MADERAPGEDRLWCIVLAAGGSRRLGTPKQLLRHGPQPLILHAVDSAWAVAPDRVAVVLGAQAPRLRVLLARHRPEVTVVRNARWRSGLASSLQAGLEALPARAAAALFVLVDQPGVDEAALARLVAAWRARPRLPAAAYYEGRLGVPAIIPRRYWRALGKLRGDAGARALLRDLDATTRVDLPEAALDIDTPEDAAHLRPGLQRQGC